MSGQGAVSYLDQQNSPLVLTFNGLKPGKKYDVVYFAHRNKYGWDRASLVTLSGHDTFTNVSSIGTDNLGAPLFSGPNDISTRLPADNDAGYIARFSNIDPGSDGKIEVTISFDGDTASQFKGKYGSAIRLKEE